MAFKKDENKLATGFTILIIGFIHLIDKTKIISVNSQIWQEVIDWRSYVIVAAFSFLIIKSDKTMGIIFLILGILLRIGAIIKYIGSYEIFLTPVILIIIGLTLIVGVLRK